jgi:protein-S-isoprenylcysteine O-methyltransferase Ste14
VPAPRRFRYRRTADADASAGLGSLQILVGLLAGVAALIYITGGIVLALRLALSGLPALGVVGQLPREFLFSLGFGLVVAPSVAFGITAGLLETGQVNRTFYDSHQPWRVVKRWKERRRAYLAFYGALPVLVIAPGLVVAMSRDPDLTVTQKRWLVAGVCVIALAELVNWSVRALRSREVTQVPEDRQRFGPMAWLWSVHGLLLVAALALWVRLSVEPASWAYFGLCAAWLAGFLTALLVVYIRATVGDQYRKAEVERERVALTVASWGAYAVLAVPLCVGVAAATKIEDGVVCSIPAEGKTFNVGGDFVGETKEHVYIGSEGRIYSIPTDKVTRLIAGTRDKAECIDSG